MSKTKQRAESLAQVVEQVQGLGFNSQYCEGRKREREREVRGKRKKKDSFRYLRF
jgi:hypothetical protein